MYQMLKNAFTYNLIQYSNREHAIYLSFQGPYAVCRAHWFLYSNLYLWNFCKHEVRSFSNDNFHILLWVLNSSHLNVHHFVLCEEMKRTKRVKKHVCKCMPPYTSPWFSCSVMMWTRSPLPQVDRYKQVRNTPVLASVFK